MGKGKRVAGERRKQKAKDKGVEDVGLRRQRAGMLLGQGKYQQAKE